MKNILNESDLSARTSEQKYPVPGEYYRDQTTIIHSTPFRRLKHKTQVFFAPENDHVCTRIEHVMHVATIAATICKGLINHGWSLDPELAFAIGIGHDIGHAPFGHSGEAALSKKLQDNGGFMHEVNGFRVVEYLACHGQGLNLTYAVKDGILCHNGEKFEQTLTPTHQVKDLTSINSRNHIPSTWEGCIVRFADKVAYLGRDIEDAIVAGYISINDIPESVRALPGGNNAEIIDALVNDIIENSRDSEAIQLSEGAYNTIKKLSEFNYKYIYRHPDIVNYKRYGEKIVSALFDYLIDLYSCRGKDYNSYNTSHNRLDRAFGDYLKEMHSFYQKENTNANVIACDYVSGMTDLYVFKCFKWITMPEPIQFKK